MARRATGFASERGSGAVRRQVWNIYVGVPVMVSTHTDSMQALAEMLDQAGVGVAKMDTNGQYLFASAPYARMLGRTHAELLQTRLHDVTHGEDLALALDAMIRTIDTGFPAVVEYRHVRPDGSYAWTRNSISLARDASGNPQYLLLIAQDIQVLKQADQAPNRGQPDLRLLLESSADGVYCIDQDGLTTLCNATFLRMMGFVREEDVIGKDLHEIIHHQRADGAPCTKSDCPIYRAVQSGRHMHVPDELLFRTDGTSIPVEYWARPILRDGEIQGAVCTFIDLTERKRAEARQQLLNRELAHRIKNTLAMVQAIVGQSLRNAVTPREAMQSINERLFALGQAHNILTQTQWGTAPIMQVVEGAIAVHNTSTRRIHVSGPMLDLGAKAALAITMALHELCTNATKYGALSTESGKVLIDWTVVGGAADAMFRMIWREQGGPVVTAPTRKGFGSRLVADAIGADLKGRTQLVFNPDGVSWSLEAPVQAVGQ